MLHGWTELHANIVKQNTDPDEDSYRCNDPHGDANNGTGVASGTFSLDTLSKCHILTNIIKIFLCGTK